MRLAWFTPWPPQPSGIAGRSAELVPHLAARGHAIDVFVDQSRVPGVTRGPDGGPADGTIRVLSAHEFVWRTARGQYDLPVYQVGNSRLHEFLWPYLFRWPGLVVLHDSRIHHARGRAWLRRQRADAYREEFRWNHPGTHPDAAELGVRGYDGGYYLQWPMRRAVLHAARLVATHARGAVDELSADLSGAPVEYIALGEGARDIDPAAARREWTARLGLPPDVVLFGIFGGLTHDKRIGPAIDALAATRAHVPGARLLLAGTPEAGLDPAALAQEVGMTDAVHVTGPLDAADFDAAIAAVDVSLNLRWPSALETSGPWLRALAAGRATVITDLPHLGHVPALDPRTWRRQAPTDDLAADADARAVTVSIDILDEDHSLRLATRRLARDANLRARLGTAARRYWEAEHTMERMVEDYQRALALAVRRPQPSTILAEPFRPDIGEAARALLRGIAPALEEEFDRPPPTSTRR